MSVPQFVPPWGWAQEMLGLSWPQGDEDALRRCGEAWQEACGSLLNAAGYGSDVVSKVNSAITSVSCDEFNNYWSRYVQGNGILEQLAGQCAAMANYADAAALQIEATKISENVVAVILYIQILEALAEIAATFGLDTPLVAVQVAAERWAAQSALRMLIKGLIEALAFTLLPDLISETVQMVEGHRNWGDYDSSLLLHDFEHGILLGGLFALPGLGGQFAKRFDLAMPTFAKPLLDNSFTNNPFVRKGAGMVYGGASMIGGNAATYYADQGIQALGAKNWAAGEQGPFANWQKAFLQGMFQSGIHGAKDLAKDQITTPRMTIDTTGGDNLLVHRYGGAIDPNGANGVTVYRTGPDPSQPPTRLGRGSFDGETGTLTVSDKNGATTDYQAVRAQTLDRGGSPTGSVTYAPSEGGGAYEPTGVVSHGGGKGPLPAGTSELYDANGQHQGTAVRNVPAPDSGSASAPVYDPTTRPVDPGASHVFQLGKDPVVVVSGDGQTVPQGFNRPLGTNEAAVYNYDTGQLREVYTYPGDNPIPPGHQAVFNADGSFQGVQPLNDFLRPQGAPGDMAAAHTRAASGIGQEDPAVSSDPTAVPGDITQDGTFHGQNDLERYQQQYAAEHQQAAQALSDQAQRFESQLSGTAAQQRELVGVGAVHAAAFTALGSHTGSGSGGGRSDFGGGGHGDPFGLPDRPARVAAVAGEGDHQLLTITNGEHNAQIRLDTTESGLVVSTLDTNGDILRQMAASADHGTGSGAFTIFAHSDADGIVVDGMHLPFSELADHLAGVPKDVPIRLYGCEAADGAAELARVSGHDVIAADAPVWIDHRGTVVATAHQVDSPHGPRPDLVDDGTGTGHLAGDGTWKLAHPTSDGRVETRDLPPGDPLRPPSAHFDPSGDVLRLAGDKQPAPWGFKQLRRNDRDGSLQASRDFEQKLGAFDFKDPAVLEQTRSTLRDLRTALRTLNDKLPDESQTAFEHRIDSVFLSDNAGNAGNVGTHVPVDTILEQGDVRETMTAIYNALYMNYDRPEVFKNAIIRVADAGDWNRLQDAGVNIESLRARYRQLNSPLRRALGAFEAGPLGEKILGAGGHRFDRDPVATGNVILNSDHPIENQLATIRSQKGRNDRPDAEQEALARTAQHYEDLGAPLGRLSRDFVQQHMDLPVDDPSAKLPWREGVTVHDTKSAWTDATEEAGLPTADGISLTTTKMLTSAELLGLDPAQRDQFLKGLMAWMLPGRDHSLYEMALGAQIARSGPLAGGRIRDGVDPVEFYRRVLDWHGESGPAPDVPLPHQTHYQHLATDPQGFTEARHNRADEPELNELVHEIWQQLSDGRITDGEPPAGQIPEHTPPAAHIPEYTLHAWAERNGIDPNDPEAVRAAVAGLSEAHLTALAVYTTHSHTAINHALTVDSFTGSLPESVSDRLMRAEFGHTARVSVERYLSALAKGENPGRLPIALRPIVHTGPEPLNKNSPLTPEAQQWIDGASDERAHAWTGIKEQVNERLPALFDEIRVHTDMFMEALHQLPAMGSPEHPMLVFRGDKVNLLSRGRYVDQATTRQVFSLSPDLATAVHFMETNPGSGTPTLVLYELTGKNARDLSPFTVYRGTREYVFPPGARTHRVTDPERVAAILARVPGLPDGCEIIVMEEG
ncbi:hypothetical protein ABH935_004302 [Catenulispora sp. GAS73]|uniref:WXG100-like domain-containing protein n=1 Tax=Catenulispora sp. GAS73 TaxID=3156269 RepID=UPI0035165B5B